MINVGRIAVVVVLVATLADVARGQSGVRYARDGRRVYVSKDVGSERWSITRELATGIVSGLVFFPSGGDPLFVECDQRFDDGQAVGLACYGANRCEAAQCSSDAWSFIADVDLPRSFFASEETPPPPPPASLCQIYTDVCPAGPADFAAEGGEITFDGIGPLPVVRNTLDVITSLTPPGATWVLVAGNLGIVMGFTGDDKVSRVDGRLIFNGTDGIDRAICLDSSGTPVQTIRSIEERLEFCAVCGVGGPVVARFAGRYQTAAGGECGLSGEFRMFRTR